MNWLDLNAWLDIITAILLVLVMIALLGPRLHTTYATWRLKRLIKQWEVIRDEQEAQVARLQQITERLTTEINRIDRTLSRQP